MGVKFCHFGNFIKALIGRYKVFSVGADKTTELPIVDALKYFYLF